MKVGMDSIMASYFALFEVINHSFGKTCGCIRRLLFFIEFTTNPSRRHTDSVNKTCCDPPGEVHHVFGQ